MTGEVSPGKISPDRELPPAVLLAAGLDPTGGAGLALDLAVLRRVGARGLPAASCLTVQTFREFRGIRPVEEDLLERMIRAALEAGPVRAVKVGLLGSPSQAFLLARLLPRDVPVVVDPVLRPTLAEGGGEEDLARGLVEGLAAGGAVLTPNLPELALLSGRKDVTGGAEYLLRRGASALVLKGGHGEGREEVEDRLFLPGGEVLAFRRPRDPLGEVHGTGCAFSSALAGFLSRGRGIREAVREAGELTARLRLSSLSTGGGLRLLLP